MILLKQVSNLSCTVFCKASSEQSCGYVYSRERFALNHFYTPPITIFNNSDNPLLTIRVTIQSTKYIKFVDATKNREEYLLLNWLQPSKLGCNLKKELIIGVYYILLASFFGLCLNKVHSRKHCVRVKGIHIDQLQICYMCT